MRARLDAVVEAIAAALMATMCIVVFLGAFFRYVLVDPLVWTEEIARFCLVWITFLGTYLAYRRNLHISIDLVRQRLSARGRRVLHLFVLVAVGLFAIMLIVRGGEYSQAFLGSRTPVLGVPLGAIYAALPVCAVMLLATVIVDLVAFARGRSPVHDAAKGDTI